MATLRYIDDDIVRVYKLGETRTKENLLATLFWGDNVRVVGKVGDQWKLDFTKRRWNPDKRKYEWVKYDGAVPEKARFRDDPILKVRFVDVGQGDAAIIESPQGKLVLLDGGEGDHLPRGEDVVHAGPLTDAVAAGDGVELHGHAARLPDALTHPC